MNGSGDLLGTAARSWAIADDYLRARAAVDPDADAARGGAPDCLLATLAPEAFQDRVGVDRRTLLVLDDHPPGDPLGAALRERLRAETDLYDVGFTTTLLAPLATPAHTLRQVFDDLPRQCEDDWDRIESHLRFAATGFDDYSRTLAASRAACHRISRRQALIVADQVAGWIDPAGTNFYLGLVEDYRGPGPRAEALRLAAGQTTAAAARFAEFLRTELAPSATPVDGVGPEVYQVTARAFLGAEVDLAELYDYGWAELARLTALARNLARRLTGEDDLPAARRALDDRPGGRVAVGDPLVAWLQERLDRSAAAIDGPFFDIPAATRRVQARMVTAGSGVMYYAPPDPALTRPGRVWWSVPSGVTSVPTWREVSTIHHEGLPGHHMQYAITMLADGLHPWQRHLCHIHGYAEGWAHYAEQLAVDIGLLVDDAELLGVYDAQIWRAARIVVDLGLHLGLPIPRGTGLTEAHQWDYRGAVAFLSAVAGIDPDTARFEVDRYLGWPGQALAFKVGARLWTAARERSARHLGERFDLKAFHMEALGMGPMGLDLLADALVER